MNRSYPRLPLLAAIAIAVFCAAIASAKSEYAFTAPPGWKAQAAPRGMLGLWIYPVAAEFRPFVTLARDRYRGTLNAYVADRIQHLGYTLVDFRIGGSYPTSVCTGHPARYITYAATLNGRLLVVQEVISLWNAYAYTAAYTRLAIQPSLPAARESLTRLCVNRPQPTTGTIKLTKPAAKSTVKPAPASTPGPLATVNPASPQPYPTTPTGPQPYPTTTTGAQPYPTVSP